MLDEGHGVALVFLLLFEHFLFLRRVLRFLLAFLRRLMGHGSLRFVAETAAYRQYRPKLRAVVGLPFRPSDVGQSGCLSACASNS